MKTPTKHRAAMSQSQTTQNQKAATPDRVKCPCCHGTGKATLSDALDASQVETLSLFKVRESRTVIELCESAPGISQTAMNNRLLVLMGKGLIRRRRKGRGFVYSRVYRERK